MDSLYALAGAGAVIIAQVAYHYCQSRRDREKWEREEPFQRELEDKRLKFAYRKERVAPLLEELDKYAGDVQMLDNLAELPDLLPGDQIDLLKRNISGQWVRCVENTPVISDGSVASAVRRKLLLLRPDIERNQTIFGELDYRGARVTIQEINELIEQYVAG